MATETPQRRVLPARERRESAAKRRAQSPEPAPTPVKKTATPASAVPAKRKYNKRPSSARPATPSGPSTPSVIDDVVPTKLVSSKPLPSTRQKQATNLSSKDYQSIADSAILAASLHRSRAQWLVDGIFKKYWTKPVKRKGVIDAPPNNPDQKSMQKLGTGTITIEPHKFDVSFYTVREAQIPMPYYRPTPQQAPRPPSFVPSPAAPSTPMGPTPGMTPHQSAAPSPAVKQEAGGALPAPPQQSSVGPPPSQQPPPQKPTSDPVIQMLAARASTDIRLKELMKVVATSQASAEQLKEFQGHIDEFNAIVKRQEAERMTREKAAGSTAEAKVGQPVTVVTPSHPSPAASRPNPPMAPTPQYPSYPPPRPEPIIKHIVVEFHGEGTTQDRWLFPEYAVLDIKFGDVDMTCSFFVERKGCDIIQSLSGGSAEEATSLQAKWKADQDYYQPVTMHVRANQQRTIETIARAAKVLPEVHEYMRGVMKDKVLASQEYLVHQLPREKGLATGEIASTDFVDSAVEMMSDDQDDELRDYYG
jgi:hypothetical protein